MVSTAELEQMVSTAELEQLLVGMAEMAHGGGASAGGAMVAIRSPWSTWSTRSWTDTTVNMVVPV